MNSKIIVREDRKTYMDFWVSYIAFIFDYNYKFGLEYIKEMQDKLKNLELLTYISCTYEIL